MAKKNNIIEFIERAVELEEAQEEGKPRRIRVKDAIVADVVNGNGRRYPSDVIMQAVDEVRGHLHESAGQGRMVELLGEAEHPSDKSGRPNLLETVVKWDEISFDGKSVALGGIILGTSKGKDILALMEGGVKPGVSLRAHGEAEVVKENKRKVEVVKEFHMRGFDLVTGPSFVNEAMLENKSKNQGDEPEENDMSDELKTQLEEAAKKEAELQKKLQEAEAKAAEGAKAQAELAEARRKAGIEAAIAEAVKDLPFGDKLNKTFIEAVKGGEYQSPEDVKKFVEAKRAEYGKLAADGVLVGLGFKEGKIEVIGSVLERETGTPEFARASFELAESIRRVEMTNPRNWNKPVSPNEKFTKMLLERFDALHMRQLLAESRMFAEAEQTSDLDLTASVSRAMIEEAFPSLVAAGIFDVGIMNNSPERLYFEAFSGESGYTNTVTDEVVTGGAEGVWYDLDHGRITPGTVVVTSNPAGTTYVEDTDYEIDYGAGRIRFIAAGSIGANDVLVDYGYTAMREGEMGVIQRAKMTLSSMIIEAAADRLADQISREAVVFGRSQLGLDVTSWTMANLVKQLRRKIDLGIIYKALKSVKGVASNSGGNWIVGTTQDDYAELVRLIGATKILVRNRYYAPTFALMSSTNAEYLTNWDGFKRDGYPDALLSAAGFVGRVKGLDVFESTEMPDTEIIVGNRQLVAHRVFQPALIKGPYHTQDVSTGKLIAAEQYFVEEFNSTESPVEEKGAYLTIAEGS